MVKIMFRAAADNHAPSPPEASSSASDSQHRDFTTSSAAAVEDTYPAYSDSEDEADGSHDPLLTRDHETGSSSASASTSRSGSARAGPSMREWIRMDSPPGADQKGAQVRSEDIGNVMGGSSKDGSGAGAHALAHAPTEMPFSTEYRVYKRRWFGLFQLVLLNIIVSWDVSFRHSTSYLSIGG